LIELFGGCGSLIEALARFKSLDAAHVAYAVHLTMPREAGQVLMLCQKARSCAGAIGR
jgi:hypothetical protein